MADDVYTLLVQVGRQDGDGLPDSATGGALMCYAAGKDEKAAVDATVALMRDAGLAPLEVESYGSRGDRLAEGEDITPEDSAMMDRALDENAVIVVQTTVFDD